MGILSDFTASFKQARSNIIDSVMNYDSFFGSRNRSYYPSDLFGANQYGKRGVTPFITFNIKDAIKADAGIKESIALYMPETMKVRYGANYEDIEMTAFQYADFGQSVMSGDLDNLKVSGLRGLLGGLSGLSSLLGSGADLQRQLEVVTGRLVNPHMALAFKGMEFREFQFDFKMLAKNQAESDSIRNIIKSFKLAMHPRLNSAASSQFMVYPDNFDIQLSSPEQKYLFKINTCALIGMDVDYAGSSVPTFFDTTGAPVDIRMSLQFKELQMLTKEDVEKDF